MWNSWDLVDPNLATSVPDRLQEIAISEEKSDQVLNTNYMENLLKG